MGKIVISDNQLFITDNGALHKAKELSTDSTLFSFNGSSFIPSKIRSIKESKSSINKYISSHGRLLFTSSFTNIIKIFNKDLINLSTVYSSDFKTINNDIKGTVCTGLPANGKVNISDKYLYYLKRSLLFKQNIRPSRSKVTQSIPRILSELNESSLKRLLLKFSEEDFLKHLDEISKDILLMLCAKAQIYTNGTNSGHKATQQSGSLRIDNKKTKATRRECIIDKGMSNDSSLEIEVESDNLLVGSILCQTN